MRPIKVQESSRKPNITINKNAFCEEAIHLMMQHQVHHLVVYDGGSPCGIVSDRDIFFRWIKTAETPLPSLNEVPIESIVRTHLPIITPDTTLAHTLSWMEQYGTSALLSKDQKEQWGIITESDLLRALSKIMSHSQWREQLMAKGEIGLASPVVQKMMEMVTQMGI